MSQDIRRFFQSSGSKTPKDNAKNTAPTKKSGKKRVVILESDDEDDLSPITKKTKSSKDNPVSPKKKSSVKENSKNEETSKYFEVTKSKMDSIFSKDPIQRVNQPVNEKLKAKTLEELFEDDEAFNSSILLLDDDEDFAKISETQSSGFVSQSPTTHAMSPSGSPKDEVVVGSFSSAKAKELERTNKKEEDPKNGGIESPQSSPKDTPKKPKVSPKITPKKKTKVSSEVTPEKSNEVPEETKEELKRPVKVSPVKRRASPKKKISPRKGASPVKSKVEEKSSTPFPVVARPPPPVSELWVDKYKPSTIKQIVGQQGEKSNVNKLIKWLTEWQKRQFSDKKILRPSPWNKDDGAFFKAALLSGPPGVGKTTTAHLVCKEIGFDVVEFNASDTRSKKLLSQQVSELLSSKSLSPFVQGGGEISSRHVLVMDEVDGMAGNEDRGGVQELIQLIKSSRIPIICMCNDRNHPKIRSLSNYCYDLRFSKPRVEQIKGFMMSVCFKEKIKVKPDQLMDIIVNSNQDIRLTLNHLSMLATNQDELKTSSKDIKLGPWDVVKKVFSSEDHKTMTIHDKSDLFFNDYSIAPLFVQENYLQVIPHSEEAKTKLGKMRLFAKAARSIALGDLADKAIRSNNSWSLLPTQAMFSSVIPGDLLEGHVGGMINFPQWLGKNSRKNKMDRLAQEIQAHTRIKLSSSQEGICLDYAQALIDHITAPLTKMENIPKAAELLFEYGLVREDVDSLIELTSWPGKTGNFAGLSPRVKGAFTRACNKDGPLTIFSGGAAGIKRRAKLTLGGEDEWGSGEEPSDEEDNDEARANAFIVAKKAKKDTSTSGKEKEPKGKAKKPSTPKTSKPRGGGGRGRGRGGRS